MEVVDGDPTMPSIWETYDTAIKNDHHFDGFEMIDRFAFYERAKKLMQLLQRVRVLSMPI